MKPLFYPLIIAFLLLPGMVMAQDNQGLDPLKPASLPDIPKDTASVPEFVFLTTPQLSDVPINRGWVEVDRFGGVSQLFPPDKLGPTESQFTINFVPYGIHWLRKRDGYAKVYYTEKGSVHGLAIGDSSNAKSRLVVVGDDDLYFTDSSYAWELQDFGNTTAEATFFTSTPFGLVISNDGSDSTRLWDGISTSSILPLGIADTATVSLEYSYDNGVLADTFTFMDSNAVWTADEWIGYYLYFTSVDSLWEIIDNAVNTIDAVNPSCPETTRTGWSFEIISQPDSTTSDLIYPKGQATAYYQDRLFVSSKWYPWRIYYSQGRLINCIDPDAFINLSMDAHDKIVWMGNFNGYLIVASTYSLWAVDANLIAHEISKIIGCVAPKTIAIGDDFIYFLSARGVYRFKGNIYGSTSYKLEKISDPISESVKSIDAKNIENCGGAYTNKQYWFSYHADSTWLFDERTQQWYGPQTFGFTDGFVMPVNMIQAWNEQLAPSANVTDSVDWTPSAGSNYDCVNDGEDATAYVYSTTNGNIDQYQFDNTSRFKTGATVTGLRVYVYGKRIWKPNLKVYLSDDTTLLLHTFYWTEFSTDYTTASFVAATNPVTSASWTKTEIDALILAFEYVEGSAAEHFYMAGVWVEVEYSAPMDAGSFLFAQPSEHFVYKYGDAFTDDTSATSGEVYGKTVTATYQSGWFSPGMSIDHYQIRELYLDKKADGNVTAYLYGDQSTTAEDTITYSSTSSGTELNWSAPDVIGHDFSIKLETTADSCFLKGWGALIQNLDRRKD